MCLLTHLIPIEKHLQCEKLLGLAGGNAKKHGNKKSGESRAPIRFNVIHMYIFAKCFSLIISLAVFHAIWFSKVNPVTLIGGRVMFRVCILCKIYKYNVFMNVGVL